MLCSASLRVTMTLLALTAVHSIPCKAQETRISIALGATWLDFSPRWGGGGGGDFGALTAQFGLRRALGVGAGAAAEVVGLAITPLGAASATPGCVVGSPCIETVTPSTLLGGLASLSTRIAGGWRAAAGLGILAGQGMKGPGSHSSAAGSLGLEWCARPSGLAPTLGVRAIGLASSIAGVRYVLLPAVGVAF